MNNFFDKTTYLVRKILNKPKVYYIWQECNQYGEVFHNYHGEVLAYSFSEGCRIFFRNDDKFHETNLTYGDLSFPLFMGRTKGRI